eukprot:7841350-Pyramimonas_sp.AAC.1
MPCFTVALSSGLATAGASATSSGLVTRQYRAQVAAFRLVSRRTISSAPAKPTTLVVARSKPQHSLLV